MRTCLAVAVFLQAVAPVSGGTIRSGKGVFNSSLSAPAGYVRQYRVNPNFETRIRSLQNNLRSAATDLQFRAAQEPIAIPGIQSFYVPEAQALSAANGAAPDVDAAYRDRVWVKVAARTSAERTLALQNGVAIDRVEADRVEGVAHKSAIARLKKAGLKVLGTASLREIVPQDFPPKDAVYHNYGELTQKLQTLAASYPDRVSLFSIGRSLRGREIWAIRINTTEKGTEQSKKPGIVFTGAHHAREHLSVETPLKLVQHLASSDDPAIKDLLAKRDVYFIPMVNPDGAEYDIYQEELSGSPQPGKNGYRMWRKNLRKNADGSYGVDLNRNYGYKWNTGGSSDSGRDETYHGPQPFSEPETQAIRDFVVARPNLRILLSFHTFSELILYPWGHTYDPIADQDDMLAHKKMAEKMATWNGYTPEQSSDLYIASGDTTDWVYGMTKDKPRNQRIFSFTFELAPKSMWDGGFYPGPGVINSTFQKNLQPAIYLIDLADDPYRVLQQDPS